MKWVLEKSFQRINDPTIVSFLLEFEPVGLEFSLYRLDLLDHLELVLQLNAKEGFVAGPIPFFFEPQKEGPTVIAPLQLFA